MPFGHFTAEANSWPQVKSFYQDMREHNKKCTGITQYLSISDRHLSLATCYLFLLFPLLVGCFLSLLNILLFSDFLPENGGKITLKNTRKS